LIFATEPQRTPSRIKTKPGGLAHPQITSRKGAKAQSPAFLIQEPLGGLEPWWLAFYVKEQRPF